MQAWVQEEFDALWSSSHAVPLAEFVMEDLARLAERKVIRSVREWAEERGGGAVPDPAPAPPTARPTDPADLAARYPVTAQRRGTVEFQTPAGGQISVLGLRFSPTSAFTTVPPMAK